MGFGIHNNWGRQISMNYRGNNWVLNKEGYNRGLQWYRKIPKIRPGPYIFQRPFLRGLFLEVLTESEGFNYGGKFAFQNRLS